MEGMRLRGIIEIAASSRPKAGIHRKDDRDKKNIVGAVFLGLDLSLLLILNDINLLIFHK